MKLVATALLLGVSEACTFFKKELPEGFEVGTDRITPGLSCDAPTKIVGGEVAHAGTWPWLVQIDVTAENGDSWMCGGTILSDTRVLSAAHCFGSSNDTVEVHIGNWKSSKEEDGEFTVTATEVKIHPSYGSVPTAYDFAMVSIPSLNEAKPESCNGCFARACLPTEHAEHGRACWAGGWGTKRSGGRVSNKQKEVGVHIMSDDYCRNNSKYPEEEIMVEQEFCAGKPDMNDNGLTDKGSDTCQGDSGGPLVCNDDGKPVLYGVVSWGYGCAWNGYPGIYATVAAQLTWINQML